MKVLIQNQLYDARRVFEINIESNPEILERHNLTIDATDEQIKEFFESLDFVTLDV